MLRTILLRCIGRAELPSNKRRITITKQTPFRLQIREMTREFTNNNRRLKFLVLSSFRQRIVLTRLTVLLRHLRHIHQDTRKVRRNRQRFRIRANPNNRRLTRSSISRTRLLNLIPARQRRQLNLIRSRKNTRATVRLRRYNLNRNIRNLIIISNLVSIIRTKRITGQLSIILAGPTKNFFVTPCIVRVTRLISNNFARTVLTRLNNQGLRDLVRFENICNFFNNIQNSNINIIDNNSVRLNLVICFNRFKSLSSGR